MKKSEQESKTWNSKSKCDHNKTDAINSVFQAKYRQQDSTRRYCKIGGRENKESNDECWSWNFEV